MAETTGAIDQVGVVISAVDAFSATMTKYITSLQQTVGAEQAAAGSAEALAAAQAAAGKQAEAAGAAHQMSAMKMSKYAMAGLILSGSMHDLGIKTKELRLGLTLLFMAITLGMSWMTALILTLGAVAAAMVKVVTYSKGIKREFNESADALIKLTVETGANDKATRALIEARRALLLIEIEEVRAKIADINVTSRQLSFMQTAVMLYNTIKGLIQGKSLAEAGAAAAEQANTDVVMAHQAELAKLNVELLTMEQTLKDANTALAGGSKKLEEQAEKAKKLADAVARLKIELMQMAAAHLSAASNALFQEADEHVAAVNLEIEGYKALRAAVEQAKLDVISAQIAAVESARIEAEAKKASIAAEVVATQEGKQMLLAIEQEYNDRRLELARAALKKIQDLEEKARKEEDKARDVQIARIQTGMRIIGEATGRTAAGNSKAWKEAALQTIRYAQEEAVAYIMFQIKKAWAAGNWAMVAVGFAALLGVYAAGALAEERIGRVKASSTGSDPGVTNERSNYSTQGAYQGWNYGAGGYGYNSPPASSSPSGPPPGAGMSAPMNVQLTVNVTGGKADEDAWKLEAQKFLDEQMPKWRARQVAVGAGA